MRRRDVACNVKQLICAVGTLHATSLLPRIYKIYLFFLSTI